MNRSTIVLWAMTLAVAALGMAMKANALEGVERWQERSSCSAEAR